jgi:hypothetical protein
LQKSILDKAVAKKTAFMGFPLKHCLPILKLVSAGKSLNQVAEFTGFTGRHCPQKKNAAAIRG